MNKWTLKFINPQLEQQFANYLIDQSQQRILQLMLLNVIFSCVTGIYLITQSNIIGGCLFLFWCVNSGIFYWKILHNPIYTKYLSIMLNLCALSMPYAMHFFMIQFDFLLLNEKILCIWLTNLSVNYYMVYQNFLINTLLYLNLVALNIVMLNWMFGFTFYLVMYGIYSLFWLHIEHQRILEKRSLFQQSLINQSILDIIHKTVSDKIYVINYDDYNLKFDYELSTETGNQYISSNIDNDPNINEQQIVSNLLKQVFVITGFATQNLCSFITQNYLKKQRFPLNIDYHKVSGYYQDKSNKLSIEVFVQRSAKLKFIINLHVIEKVKQLMRNQCLFFKKYQEANTILISKLYYVLNQREHNQVQINSIKEILKAYSMRLRIYSLQYSDEYTLAISEYDLVNQISKYMIAKHIDYNISIDSIWIKSDYYVIQHLLSIIIMYLNQCMVYNSILRINLTSTQNAINIQLVYLSRQSIRVTIKKQTINSIKAILQRIGDVNTFIMTQNTIQFCLYSVVEYHF